LPSIELFVFMSTQHCAYIVVWLRCVCLQISDSNEFLERTFLSPAAVKAGLLISSWMRDAGLFTYVPTPLPSLAQREREREIGGGGEVH
jgi:hypothetical protein